MITLSRTNTSIIFYNDMYRAFCSTLVHWLSRFSATYNYEKNVIFIHLFLHELVESTESSYFQNTQLRTENKLWLLSSLNTYIILTFSRTVENKIVLIYRHCLKRRHSQGQETLGSHDLYRSGSLPYLNGRYKISEVSNNPRDMEVSVISSQRKQHVENLYIVLVIL